MGKSFQVAGSVCMVMVVGALTATMVNRGVQPETFFALAAVVAGFVLVAWFQRPHATVPAADVDLAARVARLEQRITDVQDVLISIDERLGSPSSTPDIRA